MSFLKLIASVLFACSYSMMSVSAATVLWEDDFEGVPQTRIGGANLTMSVVANPYGSGNVLQFIDKDATGVWGAEVSPLPVRTFNLADYGAQAGVDKLTISFDLYIPSTTKSVGDTLLFALRFLVESGVDGGSATGGGTSYAINPLARDQWLTLTATNTILAEAKNLTTSLMESTAKVVAFLAWNDAGTTNLAGELAYIDNVRLVMTPEPSKSMLTLIALSCVVLRRRRS